MEEKYNDIREKIEFYEYMLDNIEAGIYVNRKDKIIYSNRYVQEFTGKNTEEINKMGFDEFRRRYHQPDNQLLFDQNGTNTQRDSHTKIWRQKDAEGKWHTVLGTVRNIKAKNPQEDDVSIFCAQSLPKKFADVTKVEKLLKENKFLKNKIKLKALSKRELEILKCVALGRSSKEISDIKSISIHTVETHRKNIMRKLDLHNTADLVRLAVACGHY